MSRIQFHLPRFYRYRVAKPGLRTGPNLYRRPLRWIGWYVVIGRYAYCVKWGWAR